MFDSEERERLRSQLLEAAASDPRITGAAITGSAADGREDRWSDIDLAFGVASGHDPRAVLSDWTARMEREGALHHVDVLFGAWIYRVFLLASTLQVDLAFAPEATFRALGPDFRLVFGRAQEPEPAPRPEAEKLIGLAWLHALHVRSCIARGQLWRAEYMIRGVRDHALALACLRHDLPTAHGRGLDPLPQAVSAPYRDSLVRELTRDELARAFRVVVERLLDEIRAVNSPLAARLEPVLEELAAIPD
jgi:hypothetical protein